MFMLLLLHLDDVILWEWTNRAYFVAQSFIGFYWIQSYITRL